MAAQPVSGGADFANADAAGSLQAQWRMGDDPDHPPARHLGFKRATRPRRRHPRPPLPSLGNPRQVRHYVRDSVLAGGSRDVRFAVQGIFRHMPFSDPPMAGGFSTLPRQIADATYDYVPSRLRPASQAPWLLLRKFSGWLIFEGAGMQVRDARDRLCRPKGRWPRCSWRTSRPILPTSPTPVVQVQAKDTAPLAALLQTVQGRPLSS